MKQFGRAIVKLRYIILAVAIALLIPAAIGYMHTKINYDMLVYLPQDIDTMKGQDILKDEFGTGAFASYIVKGMSEKQVSDLKAEIEKVPHVKKVLWYDSVMDLSVPMQMLPDDIYEAFNSGDSTMMFIIFDQTTSEDGTVAAVRQIRKLSNEKCFLAGMTATLVDTENLSDKEAPTYVGLAVLLSVIVLSLTMDSYLVPFVFLASIGMAIIYNLGTNLFLGHISYITKSLAAVLQLGVTMDYSIFLWHSYEDYQYAGKERKEAMALAIADTFSSIMGSSITTIAGFIALCFMSFKLGLDLGLVMAKGVLFGVVSCITILPSLILIFDKALEKTRHKALLPDIKGIGHFVTKHYKAFMALFFLLLVPALYGYNHTKQYYDLAKTLPKDLPSVIANDKLQDEFDMSTTHILMLSSKVPAKDVQAMADQMEASDGVKWVLGLNTIKGAAIPDELVPEDLESNLMNDHWQLLLIGSKYMTAKCRQLGIDRHYFPDHPAELQVAGDPVRAGHGYRVRYFHQPRYSVLYRNEAAVHRLDRHRHDSAGIYGRLRDFDDDKVPAGTLRGKRKEGCDRDGNSVEREVHYGQRHDLLRRDLRRRPLLRYRPDQLAVRSHGERRGHQPRLCYWHSAGVPDDL